MEDDSPELCCKRERAAPYWQESDQGWQGWPRRRRVRVKKIAGRKPILRPRQRSPPHEKQPSTPHRFGISPGGAAFSYQR